MGVLDVIFVTIHTLIIRLILQSTQSENSPGGYSLSIRDYSEDKGCNIKHYKVRAMDSGGYFITARKTFNTLEELVQHYMLSSDGLCTQLTQPCTKEAPIIRFPKDMWEIPRETLQFKKKLGSGQFGDVWEGLWNHTLGFGTRQVAIKTLKTGTMTPESFLQEANIMKTLSHEKLVQLLAVCSKEEPLYIITEFMCNGSLLEYLREGDRKNLQVRGRAK
jgi:serine/threonine protein kinase